MNLINFISQLFELAQTDAGRNFTSGAVRTVSEIAKNKTVQKIAGGVAIAGVAGVVGNSLGRDKGTKEGRKAGFEEGFTAGGIATKQKFEYVLSMVRSRDEFTLLAIKIAVHIAKCDGDFSTEEDEEIDRYIGQLNASPIVPEVIKNRILEIKNDNLSFDELVTETHSFLNKYCKGENKREVAAYIYNLITDIIAADGIVHPAEEAFLDKWGKVFSI
nr:hypothetical protein [uncultured Capnocytophaga sp.]